MPEPFAVLPEPIGSDELLLHVGVHKTGTTALQTALFDAKSELASYGVMYPGDRTFHHVPVTARLGRRMGWKDQGGKPRSPLHWELFVQEMSGWTGRVVVSSEFLDELRSPDTSAFVDDLGGAGHVRVVVTLRSLGAMLPAVYLQSLKAGETKTFEKWLRKNLERPIDDPNRFWRRHDHGSVVRAWVEAVGPERVSVVALPEKNHDAIFAAFSAFLDVPFEMFDDRRRLRPNRSFTAPEAEYFRQLNRYAKKNLDWALYEKFIRMGMALPVIEGRHPDRSEPRVGTPQWAVDKANEFDRRFVEEIAATGANVIGDLATLTVPAAVGDAPTLDVVPMDLAVAGSRGLLGVAVEMQGVLLDEIAARAQADEEVRMAEARKLRSKVRRGASRLRPRRS